MRKICVAGALGALMLGGCLSTPDLSGSSGAPSLAALQSMCGTTAVDYGTDAQGVYSDVSERRFRTLGSRFLRGYQVTDATGSVRFVTIYPGWYPGRTVHIHCKIRTGANAARALQWTSQLYFDDTITDQAHRHVAYPQRGRPRTRNGRDDIFQDGGRSLMLALSGAAEGYDAGFSVGLTLAS